MRWRRRWPAIAADSIEMEARWPAKRRAVPVRTATLITEGSERSAVGGGLVAESRRGLAAPLDLELLQDAVDCIRPADCPPSPEAHEIRPTTAALGVKVSRKVLKLILDVKRRGLPIVLISHNMPHVVEVADRIHIHRLGRRIAVINPAEYSMSDAVAIMTCAMQPKAAA